jgi:hypothetical protein
MMQSVVRGRISRVRVMELKADIREVREENGALKIQTNWRVKKAKLRVEKVRQIHLKRLAKQGSAASKIANAFRGMVARVDLTKKLQMKSDNVHAKVMARIWGATCIQSYYRGHRGRMRFNGLVREKKGKWKELYDSEKQRRFFYNKLTGEIRWRMPQDLLDLIPRPQCDNCEFYEAALECVVCNEVYCMQCFDQVHYGGRRKDHEFRSLYDFYGARLDYGDGVFPSKWPSEVIQDEVQGWMLRVAPIRDPVACWGTWEVYADEDASAIPTDTAGASPSHKPPPVKERTFYFNRSTFEASYDEPPDVATAKNAVVTLQEEAAEAARVDAENIAAMDDYVGAMRVGRGGGSGDRPSSAYYDAAGNVVQYDPSSQGYYDEGGQWMAGDGSAAGAGADGYYDEQGNYIDSSGTYQGYYDANGEWVAADDQQYEEGNWEGYYDEQGNYVYTDPNVNGYWSPDGSWVEYTTADDHPVATARESARASARGPKPPLSARQVATARGSARGSARPSARGGGGGGGRRFDGPAMATTGSMGGMRTGKAPSGKESGQGLGWVKGVPL